MNNESPRVSAKVVLFSILGLWTAYFILITARGVVVGLELQDELLWRRLVVCVAGGGVTVLLWLFLRLFDQRSLALKVGIALVAALPASLAIAQINTMVFAPIEDQVRQKIGEQRGLNIRRDESGNLLLDVPSQMTGDGSKPGADNAPPAPSASIVIEPAPTLADYWRRLTDLALSRYFLLLAWAALYLAIVAGARARAAERRGERFRSAAKAAELRSLRYQVNPHFLFNTLNSLSALVMTGKEDRAEEMIQSISRFYRHSLADDSTGDVSLDDEIDLQEHYLEIEAVRFPDRLKVHVDLPPELGQLKVPGMILQPLVENSVKYGVSASNRPVTISIVAREEYGRLVLRVSDDGPGLPSGHTGGFGIGLANVRDRLEARFGREATIASGTGIGGYETELRLPMVRHG
ncbi:sensor histidine kinase [Erythrobacter sp. SD-21]|uniref:sensor histidine kinase n=1 Tax=Erythrobacter sp. SD-21 TaxID=161528 RepID=UPI000153EF67|nr:histidine kinase [Erythrobacter sp. SD-21]EDL49785.1 sensor histidine kinase [Erythrobacter sp. SD-21]